MILLHENFESELARLAGEAEEIKVLIAFLTEKGLEWLPEEKTPLSEWIVGTDLGITSPGALKMLQGREAKVWVFREPGRMFHPKAVYLRTASAEYLFVGSTNLTFSGISSNHEVSVLFERTDENEMAFSDFLSHFRSLREREHCFVPDDSFFESYSQSDLQSRLGFQLRKQTDLTPNQEKEGSLSFSSEKIETLQQFLQAIGKGFPVLDRSETRNKADHPLSVINREFNPVFSEIVGSISDGRLTGWSVLYYNAQWYRIPNILATNEEREPFEKNNLNGRLCLQIHFSEDYQIVSFSVVLMYNVPRSNNAGIMPDQVENRFRNVLRHIESYTSDAVVDEGAFLHWDYDKDQVLWSKPLLSYRFRLAELPKDETLCQKLSRLASALNGSLAIQ
ncbi:MAG: phospholipase D family protein [Verrucomicrobiales bacterium]|nr:phospholipase D family protein [Verrucomicrobiales bacterium]